MNNNCIHKRDPSSLYNTRNTIFINKENNIYCILVSIYENGLINYTINLVKSKVKILMLRQNNKITKIYVSV